MKINATSREDYFAQAGERAGDLRQIDALIQSAAPSLVPVFTNSTSMSGLGYGMQPYATKSGSTYQEWPLIGLALQKNHMSLYVCAVVDGQYFAEKYASKLGKVSCGKSCIRFKRASDINHEALQTMLVDIDTRHQAGERLFGV